MKITKTAKRRVMTNPCIKCGGLGWVISSENWFLSMMGIASNQIKVRCPKCNGSGINSDANGRT